MNRRRRVRGRDGCRVVERGETAPRDPRGQRNGHVQCRANDERAVQPERGYQPQAGCHHAGDGARCVHRVQEGRVPAHAVRRTAHGPEHERIRHAHQRGRHDEHDARERDTRDGQQRRRVFDGRRDDHERRVRPPQCDGRRERACGDQQFNQRKRANRLPQSIGPASGQIAADCQAAHETCEHGAGGLNRDAEDEAQLARPEHLIDQGHGAREQEGGVEPRHGRVPGFEGARVPGCQGARVPGCQGARVRRCDRCAGRQKRP